MEIKLTKKEIKTIAEAIGFLETLLFRYRQNVYWKDEKVYQEVITVYNGSLKIVEKLIKVYSNEK